MQFKIEKISKEEEKIKCRDCGKPLEAGDHTLLEMGLWTDAFCLSCGIRVLMSEKDRIDTIIRKTKALISMENLLAEGEDQ